VEKHSFELDVPFGIIPLLSITHSFTFDFVSASYIRMQFSIVALFVAAAVTVTASPMNLMAVRDCDVAGCAIALGPLAVGCGAAAVEVGANPIADAGCLAGGLNAVANTPAKCTGCAAKLGIDGAVNKTESAIGGAVDDVKTAFSDIF